MSYAITYPIATTFKTPLDVKDSINVTYTSPWAGANLTVLCVPDAGNIYLWYNMPDNPQKPSGSYVLPSFEIMNFRISVYPAGCIIRLTKLGSNEVQADTPMFFLTSSAVSAKTYGPSTTLGLPSSTSSSSTSPTSTPATTTNASGSPTTAAASALTPTSTPTQSSTSSQGISKGTAAGIGVGAALGALAVIGAIFLWLWCARKRKRRQSSPVLPTQYGKAELYDQGHVQSPGKNMYTSNTSYYQPPAEMQGQMAQAEMQAEEPRYEVPGSNAQYGYPRKPVGHRVELSG